MSKVLIEEGLGYNLLSVSQFMAKGIHLEANSTTQDFKLYHGKGGLYIGKAVLKNNVFVLDFVPDLGTADSDGIVTFTSWTHPPDLDSDFSPEGFCSGDTTGSSRDNIGSSRDNIGSSRDNIRDIIGSSSNNDTSPPDKADWDEQNVANASEEAGPLPFCSVDVPMDEDNPRESLNAETFYYFANNGYVTPATVNTNEAERVGPNFKPDPEAGDEAAYPEDTTLPRYSQTGLQILRLVTAVHGSTLPKEPATVQQALGGEHREKWREAMDRELKALEERNTWKVVPISVARNKTILTGKWVFRSLIAVRRHLPTTERAHFSQYKSAQTLYDAVVARYSSPATAALSRLVLPYLFPDLATFPTVADLITHLRTSDTRYRAALPAEDHFLSVCPTTLTVDLLAESLLAAEQSIVAVGASRGDPRTPVELLLRPTSVGSSRSVLRLPQAEAAALAGARGARALVGLAGAVEVVVEALEGVGVVVGVVAEVEVSAVAVEAAEAAAVVEGAEAAEVAEAAEAAEELVAALRRGVTPVCYSHNRLECA
ncbi:unnamed protein product [Closterium sp. NIES-53]